MSQKWIKTWNLCPNPALLLGSYQDTWLKINKKNWVMTHQLRATAVMKWVSMYHEKIRNYQCFKKNSRLTCHSKLPKKAASTPWPQGFSLVGQLCINQLCEYISDYISVRHKHYVSCHFRPRRQMTLRPQAPATVSTLDFCQSQWKSCNKHDDMFVSFNATSNIHERWRGAAAPAHGDTVTFSICSPARADQFWKLNFLPSRRLQRRKKRRNNV